MAVFTTEQLNLIDAASTSLELPRGILGEATNLIVSLRDLHNQPLVNGKLDGQATFDAAVATWGEIIGRLKAAVTAL